MLPVVRNQTVARRLQVALSLRRASTRPPLPLPTPVDPPRRTLRVPLPVAEGGGQAALTYTLERPSGVPSGLVVLALHGVPGSTYDWRYVSRPLAARLPGASLLRIEVPGFGSSSASLSPNSSPKGADLARALSQRALPAICAAEALAPPGAADARWLLLGHSVGCELSMLLAAELLGKRTGGRRAVAGLALVNPVGLRPHKLMRPSAAVRGATALLDLPQPLGALWLYVLRKVWINVFGFPARVRNEDLVWGQRRAAALDWGRQRIVAAGLRASGVPIGVLYSEDDTLVEVRVSRELCDELRPSPLIVLPSAGHWSIKLAPVEIASLVGDVAAASSRDVAAGP
jgi:pimeloyl-ACP methyl ester carboxylesterase